MARPSTTYLAGLAALAATVVWLLPADAATRSQDQQTCPVAGLFDPDTVTLDRPATVATDGQDSSYTLTAAETSAEQSGDPLPHDVQLSYTVSAGTHTLFSGSGAQPAGSDAISVASFQLRDVPPYGTHSYVVSWSAVFDGGTHTCVSNDPANHPFVVNVMSPSS